MAGEAGWLALAEENPSMAFVANYPAVYREVPRRLASIPPLDNPVLD